MGDLDTVLRAGGYELGDDAYISGLRSMKQKPIDLANFDPATLLPHLIGDGSGFVEMAELFVPMLSGLLMLRPEDISIQPEIDDPEALIRNSSDDKYEQARQFYILMTSLIPRLPDLLQTDDATDARSDALRKMARSVKGDARWATSILVLGLLLAHKVPISFTAEDIRDMLKYLKNGGISLGQFIQSQIEN